MLTERDFSGAFHSRHRENCPRDRRGQDGRFRPRRTSECEDGALGFLVARFNSDISIRARDFEQRLDVRQNVTLGGIVGIGKMSLNLIAIPVITASK